MGVDTADLRRLSKELRGPDWIIATSAALRLLPNAADELDAQRAKIAELEAQLARDDDAKAAVARLNQLGESTDWYVDTLEAREDARKHIPGAIGQRLVFGLCETIESLLAELAEARKQAIPWRDGPARGGEEIPEDRANILTLTDIGDQELFLQATWASLYGGKVSLYGGPSWGRVEKWCYQHDILPTEPTQ